MGTPLVFAVSFGYIINVYSNFIKYSKGMQHRNSMVEKACQEVSNWDICIHHPLFFVELFLEAYYPINHSLWGDWYALSHYFLCFLAGYILICLGDNFWNTVIKIKNIAAVVGIVSFLIMIWMWENYLSLFWIPLFASLNRWSWILALFGYAATFLNKESTTVKYRNQAVYPFYI